MRIGCGFAEKTVHGPRYLSVWTFRVRGGAFCRGERYMGPAKSAEARQRARRELDAYAERALVDLARRRARWHRVLSTA